MTTPAQRNEPQPNKLCVVIVPDSDGEHLIEAVGKLGVGSSGGFLRRVSITVFSELHESRVPELMAFLPFMDEPEMPSATVRRRTRRWWRLDGGTARSDGSRLAHSASPPHYHW